MRTILNSLPVRCFLLAGFCAFILAGLLPGCGSQNPSGPATAVPITTTNTSVASGTSVIYGTVTDIETGAQITGTGLSVALYLDTAVVSSRPLNNGGFTFNGLAQGIYTLYASDSTGAYASNFQLVNVSSAATFQTEIKLRKVSTAVGVRLVNLWGKVTSADGIGIPFVKVTLGATAFETTTLVDGGFFLLSVPEGTYDVKITKSGFNDKTLSLVISDTLTNTIILNGTTVALIADKTDQTGTVRTNLYGLGTAQMTAKATTSAAITGYVKNSKGEAIPNFSFKLFSRRDLYDTTQIFESRSVTTNSVGYFTETTLPVGYYFAAATNAFPTTTLAGTTLVWRISGTVYASNIEVLSGQTAEAIVTISNTTPGIDVPILTGPATAQVYTSRDSVDFAWTGVGTATSYVLSLENPPGNPTAKLYNKDLAVPSTGALSQTIDFFSLKIGYYSWKVGAVDVSTNQTIYSAARNFLIRPASTDLSPVSGATVAPMGASPTVNLVFPSDANAEKIVVEVFNINTGSQFAFDAAGSPVVANNATFKVTFDGSTLATGWPVGQTWRWHVRYFYAGSSIQMVSEDATFSFALL